MAFGGVSSHYLGIGENAKEIEPLHKLTEVTVALVFLELPPIAPIVVKYVQRENPAETAVFPKLRFAELSRAAHVKRLQLRTWTVGTLQDWRITRSNHKG